MDGCAGPDREQRACTWKQAGIREEVQGERLIAGQTQRLRDKQFLTKVLSLIHFVETTANNLTFN